MAITPWEQIMLQKVGENGSDGVTNNDIRTLAVDLDGRKFSIILKDSAGVQSGLTVEANNSNFVDPGKAYHAPHQIATLAINTNIGNVENELGTGSSQKESSASSLQFASNWCPIPGATIDHGLSAYEGSGSYRYIRIKGGSEIQATLSAYVWAEGHRGF